VEVSTDVAEIWEIDKEHFHNIVCGKMEELLMYRIRLQDTNVVLKDLKTIKVIGTGAFSVVRLTQHSKSGTQYALKRVMKIDGEVPEEVRRECELMADVDHPFIMRLVKTFETEKSIYILSELVTGGMLHSAIRRIETVFDRPQAQFYVGSLIIALETLRDRRIIFRDLKPENVMLDHQGYIKLIDFGIAKKLGPQKNRTFTWTGTPHYMAPEVARGRGYSFEVDIWSLGVILFELVCGSMPFADDLEDPVEVCEAVMAGNLKFPESLEDDAAKLLIQGLLCPEPKKRLGSGTNGYAEIKESPFFAALSSTRKSVRPSVQQTTNIFDLLMGRELEAPVSQEADAYESECVDDQVLSDADELGGALGFGDIASHVVASMTLGQRVSKAISSERSS